MDGGAMVEGGSFGPVSRFANRELVKAPSPSPPTSHDNEEARRVELDLAALDIRGEEGKKLDLLSESTESKAAVAAVVSPSPSKEEASRRAYKPYDFFDVLDMLSEEGMSVGCVEDLTGASKAKAVAAASDGEAKAVIRKHPVGCRQRNVVRRRQYPSCAPNKDLSWVSNPELRASMEWFQTTYLDAQRDEAERERLEYLKNAR